jgi:hypothetical protein
MRPLKSAIRLGNMENGEGLEKQIADYYTIAERH